MVWCCFCSLFMDNAAHAKECCYMFMFLLQRKHQGFCGHVSRNKHVPVTTLASNGDLSSRNISPPSMNFPTPESPIQR
jgi:hypothetical protein